MRSQLGPMLTRHPSLYALGRLGGVHVLGAIMSFGVLLSGKWSVLPVCEALMTAARMSAVSCGLRASPTFITDLQHVGKAAKTLPLKASHNSQEQTQVQMRDGGSSLQLR